jgi:indole-3-glycerol phosphate synthase
MNWLTQIIEHKRQEIRPLIDATEEWELKAAGASGFRGFETALLSAGFGLIAEVKKASPSAGVIAAEFDPVKIAQRYASAGVQCISVLTDERFFQGHLEHLRQIRLQVMQPLLRKDFTVHAVQIYQAIWAGADAVLLIVAALSERELVDLLQVGRQTGIDVLVEVHDRSELDRALQAGATFVGINNRNLTTFEVDLRTTEALAPLIPEECTLVSESGIRTLDDLRRVAESGVDAVLIGESLMRAADPERTIRELQKIAKR